MPTPFVLEVISGDRSEVDVREDITGPTRHIKDVLKVNSTTLVAVWLAADLELDRTNASDGDPLLACYGEDISVEWRETFEPVFVDGNVHVRSRREDPVIAGRLLWSMVVRAWKLRK